MDEKVRTYKTRLVTKDFNQIHCVDYDETFSPIARLKYAHIILVIVSYHDYEIQKMDVKTRFLSEIIFADVYMTQPKGFGPPNAAKKVYKLQCSIYGLKQVSKIQNICFDETTKQFGFIKNEDEPCVYQNVSGSLVVFLVLYVDGILFIENDNPTMQQVKVWLGNCFFKDLGEATYILGIRVYRDISQRLLGSSQSTYIDKVLRLFNVHDSKKRILHMKHDICLSQEQQSSSKEEKNCMNKISYAFTIGYIMYVMLCTRQDVSYVMSITSRYQSDSYDSHQIIVKKILRLHLVMYFS